MISFLRNRFRLRGKFNSSEEMVDSAHMGFSLNTARILSTPVQPSPKTQEQRVAESEKEKHDRFYGECLRELGYKRGHNIPHYKPVEKATFEYHEARIFRRNQTVFSLPLEIENLLDRKKFYDDPNNKGKPFISRHQRGSSIFSGLPRVEGVLGLARAWMQTNSYSTESGRFAFDKETFFPETAEQAQSGLALPHKPNMLSDISIVSTIDGQDISDFVTISRTVGGEVQIKVEKTSLFTFFNRRDLK
jgi:hypothetical protein